MATTPGWCNLVGAVLVCALQVPSPLASSTGTMLQPAPLTGVWKAKSLLPSPSRSPSTSDVTADGGGGGDGGVGVEALANDHEQVTSKTLLPGPGSLGAYDPVGVTKREPVSVWLPAGPWTG